MNAPARLPGLPDGVDHDVVVNQMIRRARRRGFDAWWQRLEAVVFCANPIHLTGSDELGREHQVFTRCNNRRSVVCPSCSDLYSRDTWQLIHAGLQGGHHGIPATVADHPQVFVTLTAPSFGTVHTVRPEGSCHPQPLAIAIAHTENHCGASTATATPTSSLENPYAAIATTMSGTCCSRGMPQNCGGASPFACVATYDTNSGAGVSNQTKRGCRS
jgi:uncharacterized Zn-finger protein